MNRIRAMSLPAPVSLVILSITGVPVGAAAAPPAAAVESGPKAAKVHHDEGVKYYNIGRFEEAIKEFEAAYDLDPHPTLLFNLAQCHRQRGGSERAIFFYKRYLQMAPQAKDRPEVEKRIQELEEILAKQKEVRDRPPPDVRGQTEEDDARAAGRAPAAGALSPPPLGVGPPPPPRGLAPASSPAVRAAAAVETPERIRLSAEGGVAIPFLGGTRKLQTATLFAGRLGAEYVVPLASLDLDFGLAATLSPLSYRTVGTDVEQSSTLLGLFATAGVRMPIAERLSFAAVVGAGVVWWGGLKPGNPFTATGEGANGPVAMPSGRVSAGVYWRFAGPAFLGALPALTISKTTGDPLTRATSTFTRLEVSAVVGLGL
jgi:hypothetical protein